MLGLADRVRFTGVVGRADIPRLVAAFDVALQPAATPYASPLKLFEYMALGCAIVAPAQPNILEVLDDGTNALLFPPADPKGLSKALDRLLGEPALRSRLGNNARETLARRSYTWAGNATRVIALVRSIQGYGEPAGGSSEVGRTRESALD
jgi:glycosyltransferase involved in cell wall biosynthesis